MHLSGHTPGLMAMNVNLPEDGELVPFHADFELEEDRNGEFLLIRLLIFMGCTGPFLFTSDHFHILEFVPFFLFVLVVPLERMRNVVLTFSRFDELI